jgi:hypothetical protein
MNESNKVQSLKNFTGTVSLQFNIIYVIFYGKYPVHRNAAKFIRNSVGKMKLIKQGRQTAAT